MALITFEIDHKDAGTIRHALELALRRGSYTTCEAAAIQNLVDEILIDQVAPGRFKAGEDQA